MTNLTTILFKRRGKFMLAACRGKERGCTVVDLAAQSKRGPCSFCVILDNPNATLGEIADALKRGDA